MGTILVTGALGFIGANFVHHLIRTSDHQIVVLDKLGYASSRESLAGCPEDRVQVVIGDICDAPLLDELVAAADAVAHFAAESHNDNSIAGPAEFIRSNLLGTFEVLEAVRRHRVRLHHISTDEVYGDLELDDPARFTEQTPVPALLTVFGLQGRLGPSGAGLGPYLRGWRPPSPTAPTTTDPANMWRSSFHGRSPI